MSPLNVFLRAMGPSHPKKRRSSYKDVAIWAALDLQLAVTTGASSLREPADAFAGHFCWRHSLSFTHSGRCWGCLRQMPPDALLFGVLHGESEW